MTGDTRVTMHKGAAALAAIALLTAGAGATYLWMRSDAAAGGPVAAMPSSHGRVAVARCICCWQLAAA